MRVKGHIRFFIGFYLAQYQCRFMVPIAEHMQRAFAVTRTTLGRFAINADQTRVCLLGNGMNPRNKAFSKNIVDSGYHFPAYLYFRQKGCSLENLDAYVLCAPARGEHKRALKIFNGQDIQERRKKKWKRREGDTVSF